MRRFLLPGVVAWLVLCAATVTAQDQPDRAVLDSGPTRDRGLLFLPLNVITHFRGEYTVGEHRIRVFYAEEPVAPFESWSEYPCPLRSLLSVESSEERLILYFVHDEPWTLFVQVDPAFDDTCVFVDAFVRRFRYFREVGDDHAVPPFPAILELSN